MDFELQEYSVSLRISVDEYRIVQEVLDAAHDLEPRILRMSHQEIDLLSGRFGAAVSGTEGERALSLSRQQFGRLGLIFSCTMNVVTYVEVGSPEPPIRSESPLRQRPEIRELGSTLSKVARQYFLLIRLGDDLPVN